MSGRAQQENGWFTAQSVSLAIKGIGLMLEESSLRTWAQSYSAEPRSVKTVGIAMAGNIPLVGFHDFLVVLLSGHRLMYKPSSKDSVLMDFIYQKLVSLEPRFGDLIVKSSLLKEIDALIATGGDNTARYFEYYFRNIPHLIRKNRVSCAVLTGDESPTEIEMLGTDVFSYYGLGCRNVSTVFVPAQFNPVTFLDCLNSFESVMDNRKYANNYVYQKSMAMLNAETFLDTGFLLLKESDDFVSPVATLHYRRYDSEEALKRILLECREKTQAVVCRPGVVNGGVPFGKAQFPEVSDFADHIDTFKFLLDIK